MIPSGFGGYRLMFTLMLLLLVSVVAGVAGEATFHEEKFHGRDAYVLENEHVRVSALRGAGHIAELRLKSDDPKKNINPLRVPHFPTIEPWEYDPVRHDKIYGGGTARYLQSGYMGHLLNFPTFGPPSESEAKSGLGNHGEAVMVEWKKESASAGSKEARLIYAAHLPKTQYNVGRVLTLPADENVLYIEEWVANLLPFDRPAHWVQHVTFGPPFVEPGKTVLDVSATKGEVRGGSEGTLRPGMVEWPWGTSHDGRKVSLREMQTRERSGAYYALLMDPSRETSYMTMYHKDFRLLVGYIWKTRDFPWIGDWQENKGNQGLPWQGKVIARGMEFGTTPFTGPMKHSVEEGSLYGVPLYRWIGAAERVRVRYLAFVTEIADGYRGVEDVVARGGQIVITERETGKTIVLRSRGGGG